MSRKPGLILLFYKHLDRSFLDIASAELSDEYIDKLIANMFGNTRLSDECDITYHDFRKALDTEMFADLSLDWRGLYSINL